MEEDPLTGVPTSEVRQEPALTDNWWYGPAAREADSSMPFVASRLGLPDRAAVVKIDDWLDRELRGKWLNPEQDELPAAADVPCGFFGGQQCSG